ncbi:hypothetical protein ABE225_00645 [Priestia megaterium]
MIGGQDEDSCGNSGTDETPQERKRRGGSSPAHRKRSLARKSTALQKMIYIRSFISFVYFYMNYLLNNQYKIKYKPLEPVKCYK